MHLHPFFSRSLWRELFPSPVNFPKRITTKGLFTSLTEFYTFSFIKACTLRGLKSPNLTGHCTSPKTQFVEILRFQFIYIIVSVLKRDKIEFLKVRTIR